MKLAVYGLGRLGYPLLNVLAQSGFDVEGVDPNRTSLPPDKEPGIKWLNGPVKLHTDPVAADINFIVVPTPSLTKGDHVGGFDSAFVETALRQIRHVNRNAEEKPLAVIVSTVSPGTCSGLASRLHTLDIVYNPTFIALGNVVKGLTEPDLLLIGGNELAAKQKVFSIWQTVFKTFCTEVEVWVHHAGYTEVELIKLSVNAALGTKISLANSLGQLFKAYGVDPQAVQIIGKDPRIGPAFMSPGGPITGPCLPRDNEALQIAAEKVGLHLPLAQATNRVNYLVYDRLYNDVMEHKPKTVGIFGMSYKYGIDIDTEAPGPWLRDALMRREQIPSICCDDFVPAGAAATNPAAALNADVIVIMQKEYRKYIPPDNKKPVVDLWA